MTTAELARKAEVCAHTIRALAVAGEIDSEFIGGRVGFRFEESAVGQVRAVFRKRGAQRRARRRASR